MVFLGFVIVYCFIRYLSLNDYLVVLPNLPNEVVTAREASYMLYGDGEIDTNTEKSLHKYILSFTSRQTPGEPRVIDRPGRIHYSQIGQSQYVDKLLKGRRNGVFLECGASNGESMSNSLFFEMHRNWTGILIEANPVRQKFLIKKNRNAFVVRSCLSVTRKPQTAKYAMPGNVGGGLSSNLNSNDISNFRRWSKLRVFPEVYMQCFPLTSILDALGIHRIDYMSLDVEGAEIDILNTVNWTKLTVDVFTIEYNRSLSKLNKLRALFEKTGLYKELRLLGSGQDVVFMRR